MKVNTTFLLLYFEMCPVWVWSEGQVYYDDTERVTVVEEGGRARLVCQSDQAWLLCTWHLLSLPQSQHCALLTQGRVQPVDCQGGEEQEEEEEEKEDPGEEVEVEVEVVGNSSWCGLEVGRVSRQRHAGLWTCSLSSLQAGRLVTAHSQDLSLQVLTRGELSLVVEDNNKHHQYWVSTGLSLS